MNTLEDLKQRLISIDRSYHAFVVGILVYAKKKQSRLDAVIEFIDTHDGITPSDVIEYVSHQPDFYEDSAPVKVV